MFPKIVQVVPTKKYTVYVYFEDGKIVCLQRNTSFIKRCIYHAK